MNKTVMFVTFAALAFVGLAGSVLLLIVRPESSQDFTTLLITVLGLATTAGGTFYALGKQGEKIEEIHKQTNGNLHRRDEEIERLTRENIELAKQVPPSTIGPVATPKREVK